MVKKTSRIRKIAKGRVSKVQALARAVKRIQTNMRVQKSTYNLGKAFSIAASGDYQYVILNDPVNCTSIFGTTLNEDFAVPTSKLVSIGIDNYITLENAPISEEETVQYTYFLVSLKDEISDYFSPSTGTLSLSSGLHYHKQGGMVMLNKKCFNIHAVKRFVLTNHGTDLSLPSALSQYGTDRRFYRRLKVNKMITNPTGNISALVSGLDPSKTYYAILFNNDSSLDGEWGKWDINVVQTYRH